MLNFWNKMKNYLLVGLISILPLWITGFFLYAIFRVIASLARPFLRNIQPLADMPLLLNITSFLGTILLILGLGVVLTNVVGRRLFMRFEGYVEKIPILSWIYQAVRGLITIFSQEGERSRFKRVVMIEYPRKGIFVMGFITTGAVNAFNSKAGKTLINIFLPTTPNPTSGFLLMVPKEDIMTLDISVEDAVKVIVSSGVIAPEGN